MHFYCIGVNALHAPIELRERIYGLKDRITQFWSDQNTRVAILATCNRFEIYALTSDAHRAQELHARFIQAFPWFVNAYFYNGRARVFGHALAVVTGLDSQIKGELQIKDQIVAWLAHNDFSEPLRVLWSTAYIQGEVIRELVGFDKNPHTIATFVFSDCVTHQLSPVPSEVAVIGTGKVAELFALQKPTHARLTFVSHKHRNRANRLADLYGGSSADFNDMASLLEKTDIVISASASPHAIVKKQIVAMACSRRRRPIKMYDLALPRAIDPGVRFVDNVILKNMDDMAPLFECYNAQIARSLSYASLLADRAVHAYQERLYAESNTIGKPRKLACLAAG